MKYLHAFLLYVIVFCSTSSAAYPPGKQPGKSKNPIELPEVVVKPQDVNQYKPSDNRVWDLLHTRLDLTPVFATRQIKGKATLLLTPFVRAQKQLILNAVNFSDVSAGIVQENKVTGIESRYNGDELIIDLPKAMLPGDTLQIVIVYTTNTYTLDQGTIDLYDGRGAYFIDPFDKNPYKPAQLWTQGESRTARCWFPTIDSPAERCTEEIYVTVDTSLTTISNGLLISSTLHADGTRTDYWRQDIDHPPYLFMLVVGNFVRVKDHDWNGKGIDYYTQPLFGPYVADVFRNTRRMLDFFSSRLGVTYPWDKYSQVIVYDYTAGAMENTSASLFYEPLYATDKDLIDQNFDDIIAHELMHQWFGDMLNIESWANLAMKESFADFGEALWYEYDQGPYSLGYKLWLNTFYYLYGEDNAEEPIVNYYYDKPQDLYDNLRYEKGGFVLQMLRNYLGDETFFRGIQTYIRENAFQSVELSDFRKAMEAVSGEDLNWFFNQWFLQPGHPQLNITTSYDAAKKLVTVELVQEQAAAGGTVFRFPLAIDIYTSQGTTRQSVTVSQARHTFYFSAPEKPELVNVDAEKMLLCTRKENKNISDWMNLYRLGPLFADKMTAIEEVQKLSKSEAKIANPFFADVLSDTFWVFRKYALKYIDLKTLPEETIAKVTEMALGDPRPDVRKSALEKLATFNREKYADVFEKVWEKDSSLQVLSATLQVMLQLHKSGAVVYASRLDDTQNKEALYAIGKVYAKYGGAEKLPVMNKIVWLTGESKAESNINSYYDYLIRQDTATFSAGVRVLSDINQYEETDVTFNKAGKAIQRLAKYVTEKLEDEKLGPAERKEWEAKKAVLTQFALEE